MSVGHSEHDERQPGAVPSRCQLRIVEKPSNPVLPLLRYAPPRKIPTSTGSGIDEGSPGTWPSTAEKPWPSSSESVVAARQVGSHDDSGAPRTKGLCVM